MALPGMQVRHYVFIGKSLLHSLSSITFMNEYISMTKTLQILGTRRVEHKVEMLKVRNEHIL